MNEQDYLGEDLVLTPSDWKEAYQVQDASNLSGVVHSYARMMSKILDEARARQAAGQSTGTDWANHHPIAVLFADKVAHLTDTQFGDPHDMVSKSYGVYWAKVS